MDVFAAVAHLCLSLEVDFVLLVRVVALGLIC